MQIIAISLHERVCSVTVKQIKNSKELSKSKKNFDIKSKDFLSKELIHYLNDLQDSIEQTYVSLFLNTLGQGVVSGCTKSDFDRLGVEIDDVKHVCIDGRFSAYASFIDIKWINKVFQSVGLDYIYSPFLVLNHSIGESIDRGVILYLLHSENGLTVMIKEGKKLLYGSFFNIAKEDDLLYEDFGDLGLEEDDAKFDDELLEEIEIDEKFDNDIQDIDDVMDFSDDTEIIHHLSQRDARFIKYLGISLKEFYESDLYESEFITKIKIYDSANIHENIIKYIEDDLLLETEINKIDLHDCIIELSKKEIYKNA
jgi:hypothetical protein